MQHPALSRDFILTVLSPESTVQQLLQLLWEELRPFCVFAPQDGATIIISIILYTGTF